MCMTDLEGHGGVVRLFLAHALIGEIGFVFYAGFPEALTQGDDADFAFVVRSIGEGLGFGFVGFAAVAGVETVKCSGNGSVGQRLAVEKDADFETFADVDVGGVVQRNDFQMLSDLLGDDGGVCAFVSDVDDVFTEHSGLFAIAGIRHFFDARLFPACAVFGPEGRLVFGDNEVAAVFNGLFAAVLVVERPFLNQIFFAFFGNELHGLAENVQAVFGNGFEFGELAVAQFGLQVFAAVCMGGFDPDAVCLGGCAEQERGCDEQCGFFHGFSKCIG